MKIRLFILAVLFILALSSLNTFSEENTRYASSISSNKQKTPSDHTSKEEIKVFENKVEINKENIMWASIEDTHSMEPTLNSNSITLEVKPTISEIDEGDIISYKHEDIFIIHRVVFIGEDENGLFYITKGDNNEKEDPYKVRFEDVEGLVIGIIY